MLTVPIGSGCCRRRVPEKLGRLCFDIASIFFRSIKKLLDDDDTFLTDLTMDKGSKSILISPPIGSGDSIMSSAII